MTFQKRLKRVMKQRGWRVADLARAFDEPYTTTREWVLHGRTPTIDKRDVIDRVMTRLENGTYVIDRVMTRLENGT